MKNQAQSSVRSGMFLAFYISLLTELSTFLLRPNYKHIAPDGAFFILYRALRYFYLLPFALLSG